MMEVDRQNSLNSTPESLDLTPVQQFYADAHVFVTGGSGFLGQILLEKLLRSCPTISTIYMLIRSKKGKDIHTRVDEIFDSDLFENLRKEQPKFRHKVVPIAGDCGLPNLGLALTDWKTLIDNVDVVFHAAATVRFDEKLKVAVSLNIKAVQDVVKLCKEMKHLKSFMHVSTAFGNCPRNTIEEKIYAPPILGASLIELVDSKSDAEIEELTPKLLGEWPNTYAFTKCVAENILQKEARDLPLGIFRPAIVISSYKEPLIGWINNHYGPTGVVAGVGVGLIRTLHADHAKEACLVPVDMCVNSLITAAWEVNAEYERLKNDKETFEIPVYNYVTSNEAPITWGQFMDLSLIAGHRIPSIKTIWYYYITLHKYFIPYLIAVLFTHFLPAFLVDMVLLCMGKEQRLVKAYKKIYKFSDVISYFAMRQWKFGSNRVRGLVDKLTDKDKTIFFSDMRLMNWEEYLNFYVRGIRFYLMQDPFDTIYAARARLKRFYYLHQSLKVLFVILVVRVIWSVLLSGLL